jgi:internalin A
LPGETLDTADAQSILAAYRRYRTAAEQKTLRPLNEAKLLVVGNEAVGKTSLIRYLVENAPRNPSEPKTPGTAIHEQINTQAWVTAEDSVTLNIWDFGGQEIMHGTHRFFLTARSLYLLVLEDRRQDDRSVYDWLKTIRNRGDQSPVIVVINKSDEGIQDLRLDESALRQDYPTIVAFVRTCCDAGEWAAATIQKLREVIADSLANDERLKHVHDNIPEPWLRVKSAVAKMAPEQRVLARRDFDRLCEQPGSEAGNGNTAIPDRDEQRALLRLLHDLGVVVAHGLKRDAPSANREIMLLDPNWLTGAIYTLLNSPTVRDQAGEFGRVQMGDLLDAKLYPKHWHEFILGMMQDPEVGLCFELPGSDHERYLVPEVLPANEPDFRGIWSSNSLRFLYEYSFLHPSLIPRFIVQAHRNLTEKPTRWRTGVLLGAAGCKVLVRGDCDRRRIDIHVAGPAERQRAALNVVLNDLEHVHELNPEIGAKARVPLPDHPEVSVSYEHLLDMEEKYGPGYELHREEADRPYTVRELLEGVRRDKPSHVKEERNPVSNIEINIGKNAKVGDLAVGEKIKLSKTAGTDSGEEIKALLQQLAEQVAKVAEKLADEEAAADVADNLERFTAEVTKDNPKQKWWLLSAEGIREAAESVGTAGTTTITLLEKLGGLLG